MWLWFVLFSLALCLRSNWPTTSGTPCQVSAASCSPSCWRWTRRPRNTGDTDLMTRPAKPSSCCSQYPAFLTASAFTVWKLTRMSSTAPVVLFRSYWIAPTSLQASTSLTLGLFQDGAAVLRGLWEKDRGFRGPGGHGGVVWWSENQPDFPWTVPIRAGQGDTLPLKECCTNKWKNVPGWVTWHVSRTTFSPISRCYFSQCQCGDLLHVATTFTLFITRISRQCHSWGELKVAVRLHPSHFRARGVYFVKKKQGNISFYKPEMCF